MADGLLPHLVETCLRARAAAGVGRGKIANAAGIDLDTVRRFETEPSWKRETDRLVAGYATVSDRDPADLWAEAVHRWRRDLLDH